MEKRKTNTLISSVFKPPRPLLKFHYRSLHFRILLNITSVFFCHSLKAICVHSTKTKKPLTLFALLLDGSRLHASLFALLQVQRSRSCVRLLVAFGPRTLYVSTSLGNTNKIVCLNWFWELVILCESNLLIKVNC